MDDTDIKADAVPAALRAIAEKLDAFVEPELREATGWAPATVVSYRKRGLIEAVRVGKHYVYLKASALERAGTRRTGGSNERRRVAKAAL